jgi:hypothetical protein
MTDFATEWQKVKCGEPSRLFASDMLYGVHQSPRHYSKSKPPLRKLTDQQKSYRHATYNTPSSPVWPEFAGHSTHRTPGVSQIVMEANSRKAQAVFAQAEYTLSKFKSRSW